MRASTAIRKLLVVLSGIVGLAGALRAGRKTPALRSRAAVSSSAAPPVATRSRSIPAPRACGSTCARSSPSDTFAITAPSGLPVEAAGADALVSQADRTGTSDPLGQYQDELYLDAPEPGAYTIDSAADFIGIVLVEGGAKLQAWMDGIGSNGLIPAPHAVRDLGRAFRCRRCVADRRDHHRHADPHLGSGRHRRRDGPVDRAGIPPGREARRLHRDGRARVGRRLHALGHGRSRPRTPRPDDESGGVERPRHAEARRGDGDAGPDRDLRGRLGQGRRPARARPEARGTRGTHGRDERASGPGRRRRGARDPRRGARDPRRGARDPRRGPRPST